MMKLSRTDVVYRARPLIGVSVMFNLVKCMFMIVSPLLKRS